MKKINVVKSNTKVSLRNVILMSVCGILALSSIFMTIETATSGLEISKLEKTEAELSNQKKDLEESLVRTLSVSELQEKSSGLGFTKPTNLVYVAPTAPVAKLP